MNELSLKSAGAWWTAYPNLSRVFYNLQSIGIGKVVEFEKLLCCRLGDVLDIRNIASSEIPLNVFMTLSKNEDAFIYGVVETCGRGAQTCSSQARPLVLVAALMARVCRPLCIYSSLPVPSANTSKCTLGQPDGLPSCTPPCPYSKLALGCGASVPSVPGFSST
jgi:hypothetical protein